MGLIFNGNGDVIKAVDGSLTVEGLDLGGGTNVNAGIGTFSDLKVTGTLTYEDVKNVDSVGIISARTSIHVGYGVSAAGIVTATSFSGSGASLTALNATNLGSGTVPTARLGSGTANNSVFLRGDNTWATVSAATSDKIEEGTTKAEVVDTGSDGHFKVETEGVERLRIEPGGNIGIGTDDANNLLQVYGGKFKVQSNPSDTSTDLDLIRAQCGSTGGALFSIRAADAADNNSDWDIKTNANESLSFTIGASTEKVRIASTGEVLIGTATTVANTKLAVYGSGTTLLRVANSDDGIVGLTLHNTGSSNWNIKNEDAKLRLECANNEKLRIASNGHVAIGGYGDPASILDVREEQDGAETKIRLINTDNGDTTTQTAAFYMSPDSRGTALSGLRAIKENADFSTTAGRDIALSLNVTQNNAQVEALRILSDGKVGIGITVPLSELHVESSTGGHIILSDSDAVRQNGIRCVSSDNLLIYADANNEGGASFIRFEIDGSEKIRFDDGGRILINTTSNTNAHTQCDDLVIGNTSHGHDTGITIVSGTSYNGWIAFSDGTSTADQRKGAIVYHHPSDTMYFRNSGNTTKMSIDDDGLKFNGDTSSDNALNDFETGTWTATSREGTVNNNQTCKYTKIGNMVWVCGAVNTFSQRSGTVDVGITNLPFTVAENAMGSAAFYRVANTDDAHVGALANTSERIQFLVSSQGGSESWYYIDYEDLNSSGSQIKFSVWYRTTQ